MSELDGLWKVERVKGLLPPLLGVRKRIDGARGETKVGRFPGVSFDVEGRQLRYRAPLLGLVDVLEPEPGGFRGSARFLGREYAQFRLRPLGLRAPGRARETGMETSETDEATDEPEDRTEPEHEPDEPDPDPWAKTSSGDT